MRAVLSIIVATFITSSLTQAQEEDYQPPRLRIRVVLPESIPAVEAGLTAWLDGRLLGDLPGEYTVEPGEHVLTVKQHEALVAEGPITVKDQGITAFVAKFGAVRVVGDEKFLGSPIYIDEVRRGLTPAILLVPADETVTLRIKVHEPSRHPIPEHISVEPGRIWTVRLQVKNLRIRLGRVQKDRHPQLSFNDLPPTDTNRIFHGIEWFTLSIGMGIQGMVKGRSALSDYESCDWGWNDDPECWDAPIWVFAHKFIGKTDLSFFSLKWKHAYWTILDVTFYWPLVIPYCGMGVGGRFYTGNHYLGEIRIGLDVSAANFSKETVLRFSPHLEFLLNEDTFNLGIGIEVPVFVPLDGNLIVGAYGYFRVGVF